MAFAVVERYCAAPGTSRNPSSRLSWSRSETRSMSASSCSDVRVSVKRSRSSKARPLSGSREDESASLAPIYFES